MRKRQVVQACLGRERYERLWDAASGTGHLAADLAPRCGAVVATDASPSAVDLTAARLAGVAAEVEVVTGVSALPDRPAAAVGCDLVVLSEVLYYLSDAGRAALPGMLAAATAGSAHPAEVVAVTWRHHPHDGFLSGEQAHRQLGQALEGAGWRSAVDHHEADFVLSTWAAGAE